jgi:hypothetical protein
MSRRRKQHVIETGDWPAREGRKRVLVEHPDGAQLWAYAEILREAGYDVATCTGEHPDGEARCPLIETGHCGLVEGADVVVSTCSIHRGDKLLAVLGSKGSTPVVFEAPQPDFERYAHLAENATLIATPVTEQTLLDAVAHARSEAAEIDAAQPKHRAAEAHPRTSLPGRTASSSSFVTVRQLRAVARVPRWRSR